MEGLIFDVQRFSVHDGPGIRTTFFLKGCPLRCAWCHNPEGLEKRVQLQYLADECIGCGACADACLHQVHSLKDGVHRLQFDSCRTDGQCVQQCPSQALRLLGRTVTAEEVVGLALRDRPFYGQTGGVTFSGGEATLQGAFLLEALQACRAAGLHTAVDTCGCLSRPLLQQLAETADLFLYDIKAVTPEIHRAGTGVDNHLILENFDWLIRSGARVWVRTPVVGGFNASQEEIRRIAAFLRDHPGAEQVELMPYHKLGIGKYTQIGRPMPDDAEKAVSHDQMESYFQIFERFGLPVRGAERKK